ncbi:ATP-binding protein [Pantoea sp.]|uniref:ATP-binding protein n=1 Tax=Pantoea sp. TaxID=69393 RepID=UPI00289EE1BC|nr:transporter substrate-binding domain-containing protein [Pantoea sp.]
MSAFFRLLLSLVIIGFVSGAQGMPEPLKLLARTRAVLADPGLTPDEWRWVREQRQLRLAIWTPVTPPFSITSGLHDYDGINADFLGLVADNLNVSVQVLLYPTRQAALNALEQGEADLIPQAGAEEQQRDLVLSQPYSDDIVVEVSNAAHPTAATSPKKIAFTSEALQARLASQYADDEIVAFSSGRHALEQLAFHRIDRVISNAIVARYLINQSSLNNLQIQPLKKHVDAGFAFAAPPQKARWIALINRVLNALPDAPKIEIMRRWNGGIPLSQSERPLDLTPLERQWIADRPTLNVAVVEGSAPLAWFDKNNRLRGIAADILTAIGLRTGLYFTVHRYASYPQALEAVKRGDSDLLAGATQENVWSNDMLATRAWLLNSWVYVSRKNVTEIQTLKTLAALPGLAPERWLDQYQRRQLLQADSWRTGLEWVASGKADAIVMPLIIASPMLARGYAGKLKILAGLDTEPMRFVLGTSRKNIALVAILNKALLNIPPEDLHAITRQAWLSSFSSMPLQAQRKPGMAAFWGGALLLILAGILWHILALRRAKRLADHANRAKSVFLTTLSHEIRTPISAIIGRLELVLQRPKLDERARPSVNIAHEAAQSLLSLMNDLLDVARIEANRLLLRPERAAIRPLLESIALLFEGVAQQKGLTIKVELDARLQGDVLADAVRLKQVMANLLSNAIKFTATGQVGLQALVSADSENYLHLLLRVEDNGKGIDEKTRQRLFRPFEQGESGAADGGSGLGLYICRVLIEMMGGSIRLSSQPGQGTRVEVALSLPKMAAAAIRTDPDDGSESAPLPEFTILVVDDNPLGLLLLQEQLIHLRQQTVCAGSGAEALARLNERAFDLVMTDCQMPEMDGFALAAAVRQRYPALPVWGVTADAQRSASEACLSAGMACCLTKPLTLRDLKRALRALQPAASLLSPELREFSLRMLPPALLNGDNRQRFLLLQTEGIERTLAGLQAWQQTPSLSLSSSLHRQRGALDMFGLASLSALCRELEQQAEPEGVARLIALLTELRTLLQNNFSYKS